MDFFELVSNWINVNYRIESLIKNLQTIQHHGAMVGTPTPTKNSNVFIQEVPAITKPNLNIEDGEITWNHGALSGAWGTTRCQAILQYALPLAKDGSYPPILINIRVNATIKLKPKNEFKDIKEFTPLYKMLLHDYGGDKAGFCTAMGTRTISEYNKFGTVEGVLYHELLHVALAKVFANQLRRQLLEKISGSSYETREKAITAFSKAVAESWKDWRGLLLHDASFLDERFIWEKECAYYIKQYEEAGKPGLSTG